MGQVGACPAAGEGDTLTAPREQSRPEREVALVQRGRGGEDASMPDAAGPQPPSTERASDGATRPDLRVQAAGPAHAEAQAALFQAAFGPAQEAGAAQPAEVLAWRYQACPHGDPVVLLGWSQDRAVSGYACNPRQIGWDDQAVTVGQTGDVMSHPDARGQGFFTRLDRAAMEATAARGWPVVFGLPNRQSAPLFLERLGWQGVGRLRPWDLRPTERRGGAARTLAGGAG